MARNRKEREAYAYLHGHIESVHVSVLKKWQRHNNETGMFRALKKEKTERIIKRDTDAQLNDL